MPACADESVAASLHSEPRFSNLLIWGSPPHRPQNNARPRAGAINSACEGGGAFLWAPFPPPLLNSGPTWVLGAGPPGTLGVLRGGFPFATRVTFPTTHLFDKTAGLREFLGRGARGRGVHFLLGATRLKTLATPLQLFPTHPPAAGPAAGGLVPLAVGGPGVP